MQRQKKKTNKKVALFHMPNWVNGYLKNQVFRVFLQCQKLIAFFLHLTRNEDNRKEQEKAKEKTNSAFNPRRKRLCLVNEITNEITKTNAISPLCDYVRFD